MNHEQDWEVVVFQKSSPTPTNTTLTKKNGIQERTRTNQKSRVLDSDEPPKPRTYRETDPTIQRNVIQLRLDKKMKQPDLAKALHVDVTTIKKIEDGTGIYDGNLVNKINRYFKASVRSS